MALSRFTVCLHFLRLVLSIDTSQWRIGSNSTIVGRFLLGRVCAARPSKRIDSDATIVRRDFCALSLSNSWRLNLAVRIKIIKIKITVMISNHRPSSFFKIIIFLIIYWRVGTGVKLDLAVSYELALFLPLGWTHFNFKHVTSIKSRWLHLIQKCRDEIIGVTLLSP